MKVRQLRKRHYQRFLINCLGMVVEIAYDSAKSLNKVKQHGPTRR